MSRKSRWPSYDRKALEKMYKDPEMTVEEMARKLKRTPNAIRLMASRMKLKRPGQETKECFGVLFDPEKCIKKEDCDDWRGCAAEFYKSEYGDR